MKGNGFLWVTGAASACVLAACFYMIWSGWTINPANCGEYRVLSIHSQERGLIVNGERVTDKKRIGVCIIADSDSAISPIPEVGEVWQVNGYYNNRYRFVERMEGK